ncbi:MAG: DUF3160 domain-containing protein [Myxococcales bacterium]|nr:MAG: DUF3160 domain-containing protein [Myxococcales bacterium]
MLRTNLCFFVVALGLGFASAACDSGGESSRPADGDADADADDSDSLIPRNSSCADDSGEFIADESECRQPQMENFSRASLNEEASDELEELLTAMSDYRNLTPEEFQQRFGSDKEYLDGLGQSVLEAENLSLIRNAYPLDEGQQAALAENGFVILDDVRYDTFFQAYKEIYSRDLPIYVSVDSLLDALHLTFDRTLMDVEHFVLYGELETMLREMDEAIPTLGLGGAEEGEQVLDDVAAYVCTARNLLSPQPVGCGRCVAATVEHFLSLVAAEEIVGEERFGAKIIEDYSQFKPRGHYTKTERLKRYFRAMMWLQRVRFDFTEYPRHAADALVLAQLLESTGAMERYDRIDRIVRALVGVSDSLNARGMLDLALQAGIDDAADLLTDEAFLTLRQRAFATGAGMQRIRSQFMDQLVFSEEEFTPTPPAYYLMGQRYVVDSHVFSNVTHPRVAGGRCIPSSLDAMFALGNAACAPLLAGEIQKYDDQPQLAAMKDIVDGYDENFWSSTTYNDWLSALRTLDADTTGEAYPPVMRTETWDRRMLQAQLGSWAHLRHDTILYAKQSYSDTACDYPDGWVDPYPEFYRTLDRLMEQLGTVFTEEGLANLFLHDEAGDLGGSFSGNEAMATLIHWRETLVQLADIAQAEVAGLALNEAQIAFLNQMIFDSADSGAPPFDGWYPRLIYKYAPENSEIFDPTIADVHTGLGDLCDRSGVLHVGVGWVNPLLIVVETSCMQRAYIGPAFSFHETLEEERLTDEVWKERLESDAPPARPDWTGDFIR